MLKIPPLRSQINSRTKLPRPYLKLLWKTIWLNNRNFAELRAKLGAASFFRNVIPLNHCFAETSSYRIVVSPKKNITERNLTESSHSRIVELLELNNAEQHFSESLFSRTLFSRIVVLAEHTFHESSFSRTSFSPNIICPNDIFPKFYGDERHFTEHCDLTNTYRIIQETIRVRYQ